MGNPLAACDGREFKLKKAICAPTSLLTGTRLFRLRLVSAPHFITETVNEISSARFSAGIDFSLLLTNSVLNNSGLINYSEASKVGAEVSMRVGGGVQYEAIKMS